MDGKPRLTHMPDDELPTGAILEPLEDLFCLPFDILGSLT